MRSFSRRSIGGAAMLVAALLPSLTTAQAPRRARGAAVGPNPIAPLIDMRRELDLTPRQVAALDSIERSLLQKNGTVAERLRSRRDSVLGNDRRNLSPEDRQSLRARLDSLAPLRQQVVRNDSIARAAAFRVLTDSQRVRVREMQAERRGFAEARAMGRQGGGGMRGRMGGMGGMGGARGMRMQPGMAGLRMRGQMGGGGRGMGGMGMGGMGMRGRMGTGGMGGGRGFAPRGGGMGRFDQRGMAPQRRPGFGMEQGPQGFGRQGVGPQGFGPGGGGRGMRRMGPPDDQQPMDGPQLNTPRLRRRMMAPADSTAPADSAAPRRRRPPTDESR